MASPAVAILGVARLIRKFERMSEVDMTPAVGKAVALVQGTAKSIVAVDTGELRGSISMEVVKALNNSVVGRVFTNFDYAPYVEFGTGKKGEGTYPYNAKGVSLTYRQTPWAFEKDGETIWTNGQVAQPFMYPALEKNKAKINKLLKSEYTSLLVRQIR